MTKHDAAKLERFAAINAGHLSDVPADKRDATIRALARRAAVVYALWNEGDERQMLCIKGSEGSPGKMTAFRVADREAATRMRDDLRAAP